MVSPSFLSFFFFSLVAKRFYYSRSLKSEKVRSFLVFSSTLSFSFTQAASSIFFNILPALSTTLKIETWKMVRRVREYSQVKSRLKAQLHERKPAARFTLFIIIVFLFFPSFLFFVYN